MIGIYKITNRVNGKVYIGKSDNIFRRWSEHEKMLMTNTHHSKFLQDDFNNSNGMIDFKFEVEVICTEDVIHDAEVRCMIKYNSLNRNFGYNIRTEGIKREDIVKKSHTRRTYNNNKYVCSPPEKFNIPKYVHEINYKLYISMIINSINIDGVRHIPVSVTESRKVQLVTDNKNINEHYKDINELKKYGYIIEVTINDDAYYLIKDIVGVEISMSDEDIFCGRRIIIKEQDIRDIAKIN